MTLTTLVYNLNVVRVMNAQAREGVKCWLLGSYIGHQSCIAVTMALLLDELGVYTLHSILLTLRPLPDPRQFTTTNRLHE